MPVRYRKEIEEIRAGLTLLAGLVADNVQRALGAVVAGDASAAGQVMRDENEINRREVRLEEACIRVMTLHQPVADELRFLVATLKVNHDLERIGDLASAIARRARTLTPEAVSPYRDAIENMVAHLENILAEAMAAFFERDPARAIRSWLGDDAVDAQASALCDRIRAAILETPERSRPLFTLLAIVQRLERLADHAANVAKNVIYLVLGEIVRHRMGEFKRQHRHGKPKVLMVCVHNSARSQMAAAWINHLYGERVEAESAGLQPGVLHPLAVQVMQEVGIDISGAETRDVFGVVRSGHPFSHVVTVCDGLSAEKCPPFPGVADVAHWDLPDPAAAVGDEADRLERFRQIRDALRQRVAQWVEALPPPDGGEDV